MGRGAGRGTRETKLLDRWYQGEDLENVGTNRPVRRLWTYAPHFDGGELVASELPRGDGPNQLAALAKRVFRDDAPPYVDFGVFGPFERKLTKVQRCRIFTPLGDGTYLQRDLPGPPTYQIWFFLLEGVENSVPDAERGIAGGSWSLWETRGKTCHPVAIRLGTDLSSWRCSTCRKDGKTETTIHCRVRAWSSSSPRLESEGALELHLCIFVQLTKDDSYWSEKVHIPAAAWVAAGARGQPVVASEAAVKAHVPGLQDSVRDTTPPGQDNMDPRRKQANRDKRAARKRKFQADMDELRNLRQGLGGHKQQHAGGGKDSGGKGKGKSKDQSGTPICFSWASGTGVCGKLPAGAECASPVKRAHKCRKCLSPSHQDSACTRWIKSKVGTWGVACRLCWFEVLFLFLACCDCFELCHLVACFEI